VTAPNVLLVVFDTARADAFEPYGAAPGTTPAVRQLAERGGAYRAYAPAPWTIPSHGALFSGLLPRTARMPGADPYQMITGSRAAVPSLEQRWLPSVLAAAGYQTGALSANGLVSAATGFDLGFERFRQVDAGYWCAWTGRIGWALQSLKANMDDGASEIEWLLGEWLRNPGRQPFFWFVNLTECHSPYLPPSPYSPLGAWGRIRASQEWGRYLRGETHRTVFGGADVPDGALDRMRRLYAGCVAMLDGWLARVLEGLAAAGLADDTIVIVTSDHGENLGEAGLLGHAFSLDERLIRVPFVVAGPAAPVPGPLFTLADVPGWLAAGCDLAGAPWPVPTGQQVAVAQFDGYQDPGDARVRGLVADWGIGELGLRRLTDPLTCATDGTLKVVRRGTTTELYDLDVDPLERSPVPLVPEVSARYGVRLTPLLAALDRAVDPDGDLSRAPEPTGSDRPLPAELSEAETESLMARMRVLGYM